MSFEVEDAFSEENQYLSLIRNVLEHGNARNDRTKVGTISLFAPDQLRFNLLNSSFPLLTTKQLSLRLIFEELIWFINGKTDATLLKEKNVNIWEGNNTRDYLDSVGLTENRIGDLGPVYGFQWRHFGAKYKGVEGDLDANNTKISYKNEGFDQLREVLSKIRNNPEDRRIILSAWNPSDLSKMALPPCHLLSQFYVSINPETKQKRLSCLLYQRSGDIGLGVPFNIASYALLTILIARVTGCEPFEFIHTLGDAHVYSNHIEALKLQTQRRPRKFPLLKIKAHNLDDNDWKVKMNNSVDVMLNELQDFKFEDLNLEGYCPYGRIKMKMAV
ncbi:Thymidylate synthase [Clydaea vesicula]|uniref:thymidylate synthase n=1 Tax=Clydaea vesicula TaxID=447962 RepID=A0AAD5UBM9_9FUNG|nr:Thymidylate synthase [Clydaea vesicula]